MIGTVVAGKYRVEERLASGAMGAVFVAVQEPLGRKVALKVIRGGLPNEVRARFAREAKIVARLGCPHVVTLFDFGEHDGAPYMVFELLSGETLRGRLGRGRIPIEPALSIARDIACGLRSAHEMGIVHRDLKPSNVVLVPDKDSGTRAKLVDFGIAKLADAPKQPYEEGQTAVGAVIGTAGYIAPEVATTGAADDPRIDLYALGVILYEMLCGAPPFDVPDPMGLIVAHATRPVPDVRERNPDVPAPIAELVACLLAKDPNDRPRDAEALVAALDALRAPQMTPQPTMVTAAPLKLPDRPSIAVQPFFSIGGTDSDVLFAEGVSEEILTALSRFRQLFVVSQMSMLAPGGRDTDVLRVGRAVGVRYVVQGSVRRGGDRLRVSAKLVDVERGLQLWGNRYDIAHGDLFELQDDVTQRVVACVVGHVEAAQADRARRMPPHALDAYDWFARGRAYHHRRTVEDNQKSREALDRAVELDPEYAAAHAWRACAYGQALGMGSVAMDQGWPTVVGSIHRALELDDGEPECHRLACELAFGEGDLVKAQHHHERAIALNPNDARIVGQLGELLTYKGDFDGAIGALERAIRLEPLDNKPFQRLLMRLHYVRGDVEEAWRLWRCLGEGHPYVIAVAAAIAALRGDADEASALAKRVRAVYPDFSARSFAARFATPELREAWLRGFAPAGLL